MYFIRYRYSWPDKNSGTGVTTKEATRPVMVQGNKEFAKKLLIEFHAKRGEKVEKIFEDDIIEGVYP